MKTSELKAVTERAIAAAGRAGAASADALLEASTEFRGDVLDGKAETIKQAQRRGLGLRVIVDRRVGLVYTSDFREDAIDGLAERAVTLARQSTADEFAGLPDGPLAAADAGSLDLHDERIVRMTTDERMAMAIEAERICVGTDKRIKRMDGCAITTTEGTAVLSSSNGGTVSYGGTQIVMFANPLAEDEGGRQQSGTYFTIARHLSDADTPEALANEAIRRAVESIGARPVDTQKVPVIMHPEVAANWMENLFGAFSGDDIFKKTSYLTELQGETIASPLVTLVDDGAKPRGISTAPFDGEGMPTQRNVLIDKGVCKSFLYDTYWARKAGAKSTGNAARAYQGAPNIDHKNLYIENGTSSPEEIMKSVDKGFFLTDTGAFGYNPTTGAYSYAASGFWIENGAIAHPVTGVTAASTTLDMLKNIQMVGNDLRFNGSTNSPTLLISEMTISGKGAQGS